jgi:hypothetical protein
MSLLIPSAAKRTSTSGKYGAYSVEKLEIGGERFFTIVSMRASIRA